MKFKNLSRTRGFTLTEAAIVLGIMGLILGSIWVAAASVYRSQRVSDATKQVLQIAEGIRSVYSTSQLVDAAFNIEVAARIGVIPVDMLVTTGGALVAPWVRNGWTAATGLSPVTVGRATDTLLGDSFYITYGGLPENACMDMLMRNAGSVQTKTGMIAASAGTGLTTFVTRGTNLRTATMTPATANGLCTDKTGSTNRIAFRFKLRA